MKIGEDFLEKVSPVLYTNFLSALFLFTLTS